MMQEPGKRIVSKGEYARQVFRKAGWGISNYVATVAAGSLVVGSIFLAYMSCDLKDTSTFIWVLIGMLALGSIVCLCASSFTKKLMNQVQIDHPLTRANTGDLPVADSLVRASQEPLQAQETVLLRAASEGAPTQEAELLRATTGKEYRV